MLSNEVRRRLVEGYERTHDAKGIAAAYGVTEREVYRLAAQKRESGSTDARTYLCGRKPKLTAEDLAGWIRQYRNRRTSRLAN